MPTLKRADFADKPAFLKALGEALADQGSGSPAVAALMNLAGSEAEFWDDAKALYRRHREIEQLLNPTASGPSLSDDAKRFTGAKNATLLTGLVDPLMQRLGPIITSRRIQGVLMGLVGSILAYHGISFTSTTPDPKKQGAGTTNGPVASQPFLEQSADALAAKLVATIKPEALVAAIAEKVANDPKIKDLAANSTAEIARKVDLATLKKDALDRIVADSNARDIAAGATKEILTKATPETISAEVTAKVEAVIKAPEFTGALADRVDAAVRAPEFTKAVTARVEAVLKGPEFTRAASDRIDAAVRAPEFTKALIDRIDAVVKTPEFIKAVTAEVVNQVKLLDVPKAVFDRLMASDDYFKKIATQVKAP